MKSLSVIVGARTEDASASTCVERLCRQMSADMELIVVADSETSPARELPDSVRHFVRPGGLVPELWAEGLRHASGEIVGLLASTVVPADDWVACTLQLHQGDAAGIGGAIEPGGRLRAVDWAVYFCRYTPYLLPIRPEEDLEVPGDNATYRHGVLVHYRPLYVDGFWEPAVHRSMRADGHRLSVSPERVVTFESRTGARQFSRQRFLHGRAHGVQRSSGLSRRLTLLQALSAPIVPPLLTMRVARLVFRKQRLRCKFVTVAPLILYFYSWWAAGELVGRLSVVRGTRQP